MGYKNYEVRVIFKSKSALAEYEAIKLLLRLNNDVIDKSNGGTIVTNTDVTFSNTIKKFGSHAGVFNGTTAFLSIPDSDNWDFCGSNTDTQNISLFVKHNDHSGTEYYIGQYEGGGDRWYLAHAHGTGLVFRMISGGDTKIEMIGTEITDTDWHHILLIKIANVYAIYLDGTQVAYTEDNDIDTFAGILYIGTKNVANFFNGYMDCIHVENHNHFSASPVDLDATGATPDTIVVPTVECECCEGYKLPYVFHIDDPQPKNKDIVHHGNRADGSIKIPGGKRSHEITVRGKLFDEDGYEDLTTLMNTMRTTITTPPGVLSMEHRPLTGGNWTTDWEYTVFRNQEIVFAQSDRTGIQEYECNFLVLSY